MFKTRKAPVRKCRKNRLLTDRRCEKRYKLEGNSNITSNRVSLPPGFLCLGITSRTTHKNPTEEIFESTRDRILNEDLEGIFNNNLDKKYKKLRRSSRISKKYENFKNCYEGNTSDYHIKNLRSHQSDSAPKEKSEGTLRLNKAISRNNSKSIFREINKRCNRAQAQGKNFTKLSYISPVLKSNSKVEHFQFSSFCHNVWEAISFDIKQANYILKVKHTIKEKIKDINDRLSGKMNPKDTSPEENTVNTENNTRENSNFCYVPKCEWIYETPPRQCVVMPKVEECAIQPAVIYTTKKQSNIYALNPNVKMDLTRYTNRQNVEIDRRYMRHLVSFQENLDFRVDTLNPKCSDQADINRSLRKRKFKDKFAFGELMKNTTHHFEQIICRPTKTAKKISLVRNFGSYKNKHDLNDIPIGTEPFNTFDELEREFTFIEDRGEYKMVCSQGIQPDFEFKFRKKLFERDNNLFNFDEEEPKMFDFSKIND